MINSTIVPLPAADPTVNAMSLSLTLLLSVCSEMEEEMEFQEFKRSYLKGMIDDEDEDGNVSGGDDMAPKEK